MLAISAVPAEHLHRPLVVTVGDDTLLDETDPASDAAGCTWCEEAEAPTYMAGEDHDPECPLRSKATLTRYEPASWPSATPTPSLASTR